MLDTIDVGYRSIDTAQAYGNEEGVGAALAESGLPRGEFFLTTKVWITNAGYEKARASIEASMEKLRTDYLDLLLIHQPFGDYYGTYRAMEELYKAGKIRAIGVSNFGPDRYLDIQHFSEIKPAVNQIETHVFQQQKVAKEYLKKYNCQIESWGPFAEGKKDMFTNPVLTEIEKNTVQETLFIPLYARKMCSELYPSLYRDETALHLIGAVDYDFSALEKKSRSLMQRFGFLEVAMRQNDLACEVRDYLRGHPDAAVVNLGCGLDSTGRSCDNGRCKLYNLDFPDVIAVRDRLLPAGEREENIPCDLNDTSWFDRIDTSGGAVFFAAGVFYYFLKEQVKALVQAMAEAFPGGVLVFDAANERAVKLMLRTWIRDAKIKDVGAYFAVSDAARELGPWDSRLRVSSRGYMLGYTDLRGPSVSGFFRFLARVGDGRMKMQIVKLAFGGPQPPRP